MRREVAEERPPLAAGKLIVDLSARDLDHEPSAQLDARLPSQGFPKKSSSGV